MWMVDGGVSVGDVGAVSAWRPSSCLPVISGPATFICLAAGFGLGIARDVAILCSV